MRRVLRIRIPLVALFFFSLVAKAQKYYRFDHQLHYVFTSKTKPELNNEFILFTNAKDNSYYGKAKILKSGKVEFEFVDRDRLLFEVEFEDHEIRSASTIRIPCKYLSRHINRFKIRTDEYFFKDEIDTILNNKRLKQYSLRNNHSDELREEKGIGENFYIIQDNTENHQPIFTFDTAYEEWKLNAGVPYGIFRVKIFVTHDGKQNEVTRLKRIDKKVIYLEIPKKCQDFGETSP